VFYLRGRGRKAEGIQSTVTLPVSAIESSSELGDPHRLIVMELRDEGAQSGRPRWTRDRPYRFYG
jgi:hypothetical protein